MSGMGLLVSAVLAFIAPPVSVFAALLWSPTTLREKALVFWVGLRGSVPIILATFPLVAGRPRAEMVFNLVFFAVLASVLMQGATSPVVARWLGVKGPLRPRGRLPLDFERIEGVETDLQEIVIPEGAEVAGKPLVRLKLPSASLVALIARGNRYIVPKGSTVLEEGDVVWALLRKESGGEAVRERLRIRRGFRGPAQDVRVDQTLIGLRPAALESVFAAVDALDLELLPGLDAVFPPDLGREDDLPFRGHGGLHAM